MISANNMKRLFIVHRWEGNPNGDWYPWVKEQLKETHDTEILPMPNPDEPTIAEWVNFLKEHVGIPDNNTYFIGHSIGCQTILRYLETLPDQVQIGGVILVTPWMTLTKEATEGSEDITDPWLRTPIDWANVKKHTHNFTAIFSTNDPFVPLSNVDIFKEKLGAKIIMEENKGHMTDEDDINEVPKVIQAIEAMNLD